MPASAYETLRQRYINEGLLKHASDYFAHGGDKPDAQTIRMELTKEFNAMADQGPQGLTSIREVMSRFAPDTLRNMNNAFTQAGRISRGEFAAAGRTGWEPDPADLVANGKLFPTKFHGHFDPEKIGNLTFEQLIDARTDMVTLPARVRFMIASNDHAQTTTGYDLSGPNATEHLKAAIGNARSAEEINANLQKGMIHEQTKLRSAQFLKDLQLKPGEQRVNTSLHGWQGGAAMPRVVGIISAIPAAITVAGDLNDGRYTDAVKHSGHFIDTAIAGGACGAAAGEYGSPLLAGGPWGGVAYAALVLSAGGLCAAGVDLGLTASEQALGQLPAKLTTQPNKPLGSSTKVEISKSR